MQVGFQGFNETTLDFTQCLEHQWRKWYFRFPGLWIHHETGHFTNLLSLLRNDESNINLLLVHARQNKEMNTCSLPMVLCWSK